MGRTHRSEPTSKAARKPRPAAWSAWLGALAIGCLSGVIVLAAGILVLIAWGVQTTRLSSTPYPATETLLPGPPPSGAPSLPSGAPSLPGGEARLSLTPTLAATGAPPTSVVALITPRPLPTLVPSLVAETRLPPSATPRPVAPATPASPRPRPGGDTTPYFPILPDSELVNSPSAADFDLETYIAAQPGLIASYRETVQDRSLTGAQIVRFVSDNLSVSPRLLLALLDYRSGWLQNPAPAERDYPLGHVNERRRGLFNQLIYAANQLNMGYYGYRTRGLWTLTFPDGAALPFHPDLNAASIAVQHFLGQTAPDRARWDADVSPAGFSATYVRLFGDPFARALDPLVPPDLAQPALSLPFPAGEAWLFSGGLHGGWDRRGSAWGAVDFAPPRPPEVAPAAWGRCYVSPYWATAAARGVVARSGDGVVVLDLDLDGDERTGWTITYLHVAAQDRAPGGALLEAGAPLGHPSCEGFFLNAGGVHVHVARRYNGEWIASDCPACLPLVAAPDFVMGGWRPRREGDQVSMGYLERADFPFSQGGRLVALNETVYP